MFQLFYISEISMVYNGIFCSLNESDRYQTSHVANFYRLKSCKLSEKLLRSTGSLILCKSDLDWTKAPQNMLNSARLHC